MNYFNNKCNRNIRQCKNLVLSSGGLLGYAYLGLHKFIDELCLEHQIKNILGVSAGSVYGTMIAIGYSYIEMRNIILDLDIKKYVDLNADLIFESLKNKGITNLDRIVEYISGIIENKTNNKNITFSEIYELYGKNVLIGASNLTTHKFEIFCKENHPNLPVIKAIEMSICVPVLFSPIKFEDNIYVDGGVINNFPIEFFDINSNSINNYSDEMVKEYTTETSIDETLGIYLSNTRDYIYPEYLKSMNTINYINAILSILILRDEEVINKYKNNICVLEIPKTIITCSDVYVNNENVKNLIKICYNTINKNIKCNLIPLDNVNLDDNYINNNDNVNLDDNNINDNDINDNDINDNDINDNNINDNDINIKNK